ncbi:MAG: aminotransferase class I/II-fold pyridoxal phosphate-dependent enzyme [Oscillospiraceae bacterium]|nr:aminotransferase class I/II-fold pyridoxal phosphate-dependent enzyme [Oscillospiraceae bacterium]
MYTNLSSEALGAEKKTISQIYEGYCEKKLKLNMARGIPSTAQLDLSEGLLTAVDSSEACVTDECDTRSYGQLDGLKEAKILMAAIMEVPPEEVIIGGTASLNLMYDTITRAMTRGICGHAPWGRQDSVKFICPSPGYDRHFSICQHFGIEMIPCAMGPQGPDMDAVEALVRDPAVKGIWCVPKFQNPTGIVYSDDTVRRIAALSPAAPDFRVLWDNAYAVHGLYDEESPLLNVRQAALEAGNAELVIQFTSTSKITFAGGGISAMSAGPMTRAWSLESLFIQTICYDKVNQLRHVRFLKDLDGVRAQMRRQAEVLRPKFEAVDGILTRDLSGLASWTAPRGGYFISLDVFPGTAKRVVALLKQAGVTVTGAGATWPYGRDPEDKNIRIAPSYPPVSELCTAMELLCVCAKLAALEKLTEN